MIRAWTAVLAVAMLTPVARADDKIKIPKGALEPGWKLAKCELPIEDDEHDAADLGGGLKLVEIYCWRAAYQAGSIFFAVDPKTPDKPRLLRFQSYSGKGRAPQRVQSLTSAEYGSADKTLSMAHKGRGVGDCGETGEWRWNGKDFVLTKFFSKPSCDGKPFDDSKRWQVYPPRRK